jgi:hypothetical protein
VVQPPRGDQADVDQALRRDERGGLLKERRTAALGADGDHAFGAADGLDHPVALLDGVAHRFFDVDVLAGFDGVDHHLGVPVVGGGDEDGVDVLAFQQAAVVACRSGHRCWRRRGRP